MPGFCIRCGAPLTGPFCAKCGASAASASPGTPVQSHPGQAESAAQGAAQPVAQPAVSGRKSSGLGKVLMILGGLLLALVVLGAAGAIYGVYWVKHKVANYTSAVTGEPKGPVKVVGQGNNCRLLSTAELQQVLGVAIEKSAEIMEGSEPGCAYYTNPAAFSQLQQMAVEHARQQSEEAAKKPAPKGDNPLTLLKDANQLEGVVKSFALSEPAKDGRVFSFTIDPNYDRKNWPALRATLSVIPGFEEMTGVGDRAMMGSMGHAIYVLKGDRIVHLELTYVPDARRQGADIARNIVSHM